MIEKVTEYIESLSNEELFNEYDNQYQIWETTGILEDGIIRTIEKKLNAIDGIFNIHTAERMFKAETLKRFGAMMKKVDKHIDSYVEILVILKDNRSAENPEDTYDYETDIKHTAEFIRDLKKIKKQ